MATFDIMNELAPAGATVTNVSDNTATVSGIVDMQGYEAAMFLVVTGTLVDADATFTVLVEHGNDSGLSDAAAVADIDLVGTEALAGFTFAEDNSARKIGYIGNKRYIRCTITPAANTGAAPIGVACLRGRPNHAAVENPPT